MANKENSNPRQSEFTLRAVLLGSFLGVVFGLVTVYIALEVGLNFSASIPIAVLSITVLKYFRRSSILENNIVQTVGSAGESIAAGVVYTIPALLFLGYPLEIWRIFWLSLAGGILGVFFMVPLRDYLVAKEHRNLLYPEGRVVKLLSALEPAPPERRAVKHSESSSICPKCGGDSCRGLPSFATSQVFPANVSATHEILRCPSRSRLCEPPARRLPLALS